MTDRWNRRIRRKVPTDPYLKVEIVDKVSEPTGQTFGDLDELATRSYAKQWGKDPAEVANILKQRGILLPSEATGAKATDPLYSPGRVVRVTRPGAPRYTQS